MDVSKARAIRSRSRSAFRSFPRSSRPVAADEGDRALSLAWDKEMLTIRGAHLPGGAVEVWYIEAYCRPGSTTSRLEADGHPPQDRTGRVGRRRPAHPAPIAAGRWRGRRPRDPGRAGRGRFPGGRDQPDRRRNRRPTGPSPASGSIATRVRRRSMRPKPTCRAASSMSTAGRCGCRRRPGPARRVYTPGQVWCPEGVSRDDVNPRPFSPIVPSNGLIGCVSADGKELLATAWEPYQELFQGVIVCLHSDFRIGGLKPGRVEDDPGQDLPDAGRFRGARGPLSPRLPRAGRARRRRPGPERRRRSSSSSAGTSPGTGFLRGHRAELEAHAVRRLRLPRRGADRPGAPGELHLAGLGPDVRSPPRNSRRPATTSRRSRLETRFRHNFLRFNTTPADLDWFDDHAAVIANARLAARLARAGRCRGILLDTEQYEGKLFDYSQAARRRSAAPGTSTPPRPAGAAGEVMAAFQEGFPDLTVFLTFGHSLLWKQTEHGKKPLAECRYGLLVPFLDGMIEAARGRTRIVDGHEMSYGYRDADAFVRRPPGDQARRRHAWPPTGRPITAWSRPASGSGSITTGGRRDGTRSDPRRITSRPSGFETSLRAAIEQSDEYVWIYTEKPRWWSAKGEVRRPAAGLCRDGAGAVRRALVREMRSPFSRCLVIQCSYLKDVALGRSRTMQTAQDDRTGTADDRGLGLGAARSGSHGKPGILWKARGRAQQAGPGGRQGPEALVKKAAEEVGVPWQHLVVIVVPDFESGKSC